MRHDIWFYQGLVCLGLIFAFLAFKLVRGFWKQQRTFYFSRSSVLPALWEAASSEPFEPVPPDEIGPMIFSMVEEGVRNSRCRIIYDWRERHFEKMYCELIPSRERLEVWFRARQVVFWEENGTQLTNRRPKDELLIARRLYYNVRGILNPL